MISPTSPVCSVIMMWLLPANRVTVTRAPRTRSTIPKRAYGLPVARNTTSLKCKNGSEKRVYLKSTPYELPKAGNGLPLSLGEGQGQGGTISFSRSSFGKKITKGKKEKDHEKNIALYFVCFIRTGGLRE